MARKKDLPVANPIRKKKISEEANGIISMSNWLIGLFVLLPLLVSDQLLDPGIAIRHLFLSGFVIVFLVMFFILRRTGVPISYPQPVTAVFMLGIAYFGWSVISAANAINPHESFYPISRHLLQLVVLMVIMFTTLEEESYILKISKALVLTSLLHSMIGIFQFYGMAFTHLPGSVVPYGLMVNRNLFGSAQALLLPFALLVLFQGDKTWKYVASISCLGIMISIFLSQTRSAWLAAGGELIVIFMLLFFFSAADRKKWLRGAVIAAAAGISISGLLFLTSNDDAFKNSIKERVVSIVQKDSTSGGAQRSTEDRHAIWEKTRELIALHPLLGVGPGNWKIGVPTVGTEGTAWEEGIFVPDRAHSVYLQITSEVGILGAVLYFSMWVIIACMGISVIMKAKSEQRKVICACMMGLIIAFALDSVFSFPRERIEHLLYFTLASGIVTGLFYLEERPNKISKAFLPWAVVSILILMAAFNFFIAIEKYSFEVHMNYAKAWDKAKRPDKVLQEVEQGKSYFVTLDPNGKALEAYSSLAYRAQRNYEMALNEAYKARTYNPNIFLIYNNIGALYMEMKQFDKAEENYLEALKLAPKSQGTLYNLASVYYSLKDYSKCLETIKKVNWKNSQYLNQLYIDCQRHLNLDRTPLQ